MSGSISNLLNNSGFLSSISLDIHDPFADVNTNGTQTPDPLLDIPASASRDNFFGNSQAFSGVTEPTGGVRFSGLDTSQIYELVLFASRIATDNRETQYVVSGKTEDTLFLLVSNNTSLVAGISLKPDSNGCISILASAGPNNTNAYGFYHLSAIKLIYPHVTPGASVLNLKSPNGGEIWQVGKTTAINWYSENVPQVVIDYSTTNGTSWLTIDTVPAYLQTYAWQVPHTPTLSGLVRLRYDSLISLSNGVFEIAADTIVCPMVILGSSTAAGAGASAPDSAWVMRYTHYLAQRNTRFQVINLARGGYTTYHILPSGTYIPPSVGIQIDTSRNVTKALTYAPFAVIINMPSNDAAHYIAASQQLANFGMIYQSIQMTGSSTWICTPQPRNFSNPVQIQIQLQVKDSLLAIYGANAINFWDGLADLQGHILPFFDSGDGIHLNDEGHAYLVSQVLLKNIDSVDCSYIVGMGDKDDKESPDCLLFPNPFVDILNISLQTRSRANVEISLYDVCGKLLGTHQTLVPVEGKHTIRWNPELHNASAQLLLARIRVEEDNATFYTNAKVLWIK